jgi:hypothetical protein
LCKDANLGPEVDVNAQLVDLLNVLRNESKGINTQKRPGNRNFSLDQETARRFYKPL